jgi:CO dehydrogenase maturation factor
MSNRPEREPLVVAVCGKGGAGKTSVSAAIVRVLVENPERRVLAIDADPAVGLAWALGVTVTRTVDDLRARIVAELQGVEGRDRRELLARLDYELFEAVVERGNLAFLAIGRPEGRGCFCSVNSLLRDIIATVAGSFDVVVIDGEAGVEQLNRRVMERVNHLVVVSDSSARGLAVARTIATVAASAIPPHQRGLLVNRLRDADELTVLTLPAELPCLGWLPEDDAVRDADRRGACLLDVPTSPFTEAIRDCLGGIGVTIAGG